MIKIILLILFPIFAFGNVHHSADSLCNQHYYVWDENNKFLFLDSVCADLLIQKHKFTENKKYLVYIGNNISNPHMFSNCDTQLTKLNNYDYLRKYDSVPVQAKSFLPDGRWFIYDFFNGKLKMYHYKTVLNGIIEGKYIVFNANFNSIFMITKFKSGYYIDTTFCYADEKNNLSSYTVYDSIHHWTIEYKAYHTNRTVSNYFNINLKKGFYFYENGMIQTVYECNEYDAYNGRCYEYDEKGNLISIHEYRNGKKIK